MRIFPTIVCLICLVSLGLPGIAAAGPAVLHAPGLTADQAAAAARQALGSDDFTVVGSVDDRIGAIGDTVVVAGATTRECAQPSATSIAATLAAARMQLDEMEYEAGIDLLVRAAVNLPCGAEGATRGQLYELFFLRGLSAFNNEDVDGAKKAFAAAAVIDTGRPWDDSYPPTAKPLFLEALQDAVAPANVREIRSTVASAYLDGAALASTARLAVGGHIVVAGGKALWLDVPAGTSPLLVSTARALSADVLAGGADGALWLAGLSADKGWDDVLVVGDGTARRFRGTGFVGGDLLARSGPDPVLIAGLGTTGAGVVLLAVGGGMRGAAGAAALPWRPPRGTAGSRRRSAGSARCTQCRCVPPAHPGRRSCRPLCGTGRRPGYPGRRRPGTLGATGTVAASRNSLVHTRSGRFKSADPCDARLGSREQAGR